jgi:ferredoxin-NADP reductase
LQRPVSAVLRSRFAAALSEPLGIDHYVALVAPVWSVREIRARIVGVQHETSDTVSLSLRPNHNWPGFRAGQHVSLTVTIDGVRHTRTFSISCAPSAGTALRLTIRAFRGGLVSNWAARGARRGDIVLLGAPQGEFVLPEPGREPPRLLFVSGGSGLTPIMSMLDELALRGYTGSILCVCYARREPLFAEALARLAGELPGLRLVTHLTSQGAPHLSREVLDAADPEWRTSEAFVCGPAGLERSFSQLWQREAPAGKLHVERFMLQPSAAVDSPAVDSESGTTSQPTIRFERSGVQVSGDSRTSLLVQAEAAGLRPAYGCRMGICHTCERTKQAGVVCDARTGERSGSGAERIRLCISLPVSDVQLDL